MGICCRVRVHLGPWMWKCTDRGHRWGQKLHQVEPMNKKWSSPLLHGYFIIPAIDFCSGPSLIFRPFLQVTLGQRAAHFLFLGDLVILFHVTRQEALLNCGVSPWWGHTVVRWHDGCRASSGRFIHFRTLQSRWCEKAAAQTHTHTQAVKCLYQGAACTSDFMHHWLSVQRTKLLFF